MLLPTYSTLVDKLKSELDLYEETFITDSEILGYFNEAIDNLEALIHSVYEDYFMTKTSLTLVSGTQDYSLPTDIYAQKIRKLFYINGSDKYEVKRVRELNQIPYVQNEEGLRYILTNDATLGIRMSFYPTPAVSGAYLTLFYIRNATRFTGVTTETCDLPEFSNVVVQYVKWRCMEKEGHPDVGSAVGALDALRVLMVETLTNRVIDEDTEIIKDVSFYRDFDDSFFRGF